MVTDDSGDLSLKNNTLLPIHGSASQAMDSQKPDSDGHAFPSAADDEALDIQTLRQWFHLPRFNQRDGLDDYDGDYRGFDSLGEMVTAHLRHRVQRLTAESSDAPGKPAAGPRPEPQPSAPPPENPSRPPAAMELEAQEPQSNKNKVAEGPGSLSRLLTGIRSAVQRGANEICAVFCYTSPSTTSLEGLPERLPGALLVKSDRLPAVTGPEAWLGALAMGAGRVILAGHDTIPAHQEQLRFARAILAALHLAPEARLLDLGDGGLEPGNDPSPPLVPLVPAVWEPAGNDRDLLWQAVVHLHHQVPDAPDQTPLAAGAPFGAVALDASRCTLCMACVGVCSAGALQYGSPGPQIRFLERDCIQCGHCRQVCPEQAVTLLPRIAYDPGVHGTVRILHQEAPLRCSVCGAPFATAGIVAAVARRLGTHWMYQDPAARRRLTMCRDCRIRSCFGSPHPPPARRPVGRKT
jgi:ferredoxin